MNFISYNGTRYVLHDPEFSFRTSAVFTVMVCYITKNMAYITLNIASTITKNITHITL